MLCFLNMYVMQIGWNVKQSKVKPYAQCVVHNEILIGLRVLFFIKMKIIITCFILVIIY